MLGLFAFFYAVLHFATYVGLDQGLDWPAIFADVTKRKFIIVGLRGLRPARPARGDLDGRLACSGSASRAGSGSTGWRTWRGVLGVIHFVLRVKKDVSEPAVYGAVLALLFAARIFVWLRDRRPRS